jgi:hypothetical protein
LSKQERKLVARARNIKPGLFKNEVLGVADPIYTLLFEGLWVLADREGRLEDRPLRIKAEIFPYREGLDIPSMLSWLERAGFIRRYLANGLGLIQIIQFAKHQSPHKNEVPSEHPAPPDVIEPTSENIGTTRADCGFLIPDSGLRIAPIPATPAPKKPKAQKTTIPEDFAVSERVKAWAKQKGYGQLEQHLEAFVAKCKAKGYLNLSWDDAFMEAIRQDWAKLRGGAQHGVAPPPDIKPPRGPDPALAKLDADAKLVRPPQGAERQALESLKTMFKGAMQ